MFSFHQNPMQCHTNYPTHSRKSKINFSPESMIKMHGQIKRKMKNQGTKLTRLRITIENQTQTSSYGVGWFSDQRATQTKSKIASNPCKYLKISAPKPSWSKLETTSQRNQEMMRFDDVLSGTNHEQD